MKHKYKTNQSEKITTLMSYLRNGPDRTRSNRSSLAEKINKPRTPMKPIQNTKRNHNLFRKYFNIHNHSNYSILNSTIEINKLLKKVIKYKMEAVGLTDLGNMMGTVNLLKDIKKYNQKFNLNIKPIIGCEFYLSTKNNIYSQILIAKNKIGYYNLMKLCSLSSFKRVKREISDYPVITKKMIKYYSSGLLALSGSLNSEIYNLILNKNIKKCIKIIKWWIKVFKKDFYLEIFRHGEKNENKVNLIILKLAKKYSVDYIIQNNVFYLNKEDSNSLSLLLSIKYGIKYGENHCLSGMNTYEYYFKNKEKISKLFSDLPLGFKNLIKLNNKISIYHIKEIRNLPKYYFHDVKLDKNIKQPAEYFENKLLQKIIYKYITHKYKLLKGYLIKRLNFEFRIIETINYPGYFLIISEFVNKAKQKGVFVGPGRGSVVGSLVAYIIGLTKIDPMKYNLLFERFLNTSRITLPDIDIDFDDKGREYIRKWVIKKYGRTKVSQIITYGTLGAKSAIKDTARVLDFPFHEINILSKLIPNSPKLTLKQLFKNSNTLKKLLNRKDYEQVLCLKKQKKINVCFNQVITFALKIEGKIKNTGIHACGILISPYDIIENLPIIYSKSYDCFVTQYDKNNIEQIGLLKIDLLGLRTLSIIKEALQIINKTTTQIKDLNKISLEDKETIKLFQGGQTIGIFQYESFGMQKYLKKFRPNSFEDLIIMNALYRPGPFKNLKKFIYIKKGKVYPNYYLQELEEYLNETNGIIVYQEQVMLISQYISNFNKTKADTLRHAISKKNKLLLTSMKNSFIEGGIKKGHLKNILEDIWCNWQNFASYAFNKSHSAGYTLLSFQAAFLKSHFPAEYMTSVLSNNMQKIKEISRLIRECQQMGLKLSCPNINLSYSKFILIKKRILYGLSAIKGIGKASITNLIKHRKKKKFLSILDIVKRVNLRLVNKKVLENLAYAGALDAFNNSHRAQYFYKEEEEDGSNMIEKLLQFGSKYQLLIKNMKRTLFKDIKDLEIKEPKFTQCKKWSLLEQIKKEKEVLGLYISYHPIRKIKNLTITKLKLNLETTKKITICGVVTNIERRKSKRQRDYIVFTIEDSYDQIQLVIYGNMYYKDSNYKNLVTLNNVLLIRLINHKIISIHSMESDVSGKFNFNKLYKVAGY